MVRRVFNIVYKEVRGLHQAAYVLALFAFGSQLLALVRDRLLAHEFGAGASLDIYYAAFRIPDLLYVLFASTLSVYVLIPFVARAKEKGGAVAAQKLLSQVFTVFLFAYTCFALLMMVVAPYIAPIIFPGVADVDSLVLLMRILLLQPFFLGISSLFGVVTQLGHRFVLYALSPLVYNIGIIIGITVLYPFFGLTGLAYGVVIGAVGHMLIQLPLVRSSNLSFGVTHFFDWKQLGSILAVSIPRAFTLSLNQLVLLGLVSFASVMTVGSVSVLQFAFNLQAVPLAIIGVSYSVAAFPILAELHAAKDFVKFRIHIVNALRHIIFWATPAIALVIVLRAQIVRVVLGTGEFDWDDTRLTAAVLAVLIIALVSQSVNLLLVRALYAGGYTRIPFLITLFGAVLSMGSAAGFYTLYILNTKTQLVIAEFMRLGDVVGAEVLALAFGYAIATLIQSGFFLYAVRRVFELNFSCLVRRSISAFTAAAAAGISAYGALNFLVAGINTDTFIGILIQGFLAGTVGIVGAILTYAGLKSPEMHEVYQAVEKRIFKTDIVAPQKDML